MKSIRIRSGENIITEVSKYTSSSFYLIYGSPSRETLRILYDENNEEHGGDALIMVPKYLMRRFVRQFGATLTDDVIIINGDELLVSDSDEFDHYSLSKTIEEMASGGTLVLLFLDGELARILVE